MTSGWTYLIEGCLAVELKAVEVLLPVHLAQVITYLRNSPGRPAGLLMNFNTTSLPAGLRRLDHPDRHAKARTISLCLRNLVQDGEEA